MAHDRRVTLITLFAMAAFTLACMGGGTPSSVTTAFWNHIDQGETTSAYGLVATADKTHHLEKRGGASSLQKGEERATGMRDRGGLKGIEVTDEQVRGENACVAVNLTFADGSVLATSSLLIKEGDGWRLTTDRGTYKVVQSTGGPDYAPKAGCDPL